FCDYCKRPGHTKDKYYKLHGYPQGNSYNNQVSNRTNAQQFNQGNNSGQVQGHRFNRARGTVANVHGTPTDLLQNEEDETIPHRSSSNANITSGSANFAGIVVCTSSIDFDKPSCKCFESKNDFWIIDSGASNHMTFNKIALSNISTLPYPVLISLPSGYKVKVLQFGDVILNSEIILHKVLYVPSFKYNLISVNSLATH
ncbi:hypothetical protein A4A49_65361, partial [Nicotiana attenuata]